MTKELQKLNTAALEARAKLSANLITYDEAMVAVKEYIDMANKKGKDIAKRFGIRHKDIDPKGFLR